MGPPGSIAHYRILGKLGEGGMGAVYRASDTKLGREVAIKILPEGFAADPDRMARFQREAQVLASLNHPHIAAIYGAEDRALVMELVDGETLAERIARGPIPIEEALAIARQIVEALEAAHEKGVIHRDLKPANVKVTPDDVVKVLDFGLAKISEAAPQALSDPAASPTLTIQATAAGIILGTAAYMPPEQARGLAVDKRADVWSFGCVLYEMLSGKRAFEGASTTDVLAAVVRAEPDWSALPAATPEPVRRLLRRCLQKDRKRRLPEIGVARLEIDDGLAAPAPPPRPLRRRALLPWAAAGIAALLLGAAAWIWQARRAPAADVWSGALLGGPAKAFGPRLSPDGQLLAFLAFVDRLPQLGVMRPNSGSWTILTHDREHGFVTTTSWAPDGSKIYFDRMTAHPLGVYSVPPLGGEPRLLLEDAYGPEALPDGSLIVAKLTDQGDEQLFHFWPESDKLEALPAFLPPSDVAPALRAFPDGKEMVYFGTTANDRSQTPRLLAFNLASRQARELFPALRVPLDVPWLPLDVAPGGQAVYVATQDQDMRRLVLVPRRPGGRARALLAFPDSAAPITMDAAPDGSLYLDLLQNPSMVLRFNESGGAGEEFELGTTNMTALPGGDVLMTLPGWGRQRLALLHPGSQPRTLVESSEDSGLPATIFGGNVAFIIGAGDQRRIAIASLRDGHVLRRFPARSDNGLAASPDGATLYYSFSGSIWAQAVSGGEPRRITAGIDVTLDPQGRYLYVKRARAGAMDMVRIPVAGGDAQELPVPAEYHVADPGLSPAAVDARGRVLVTVVSNRSFYYQVAILDPASKSFRLVPPLIDGDSSRPAWAPDGKIQSVGVRYLFSLWRYQRSPEPR